MDIQQKATYKGIRLSPPYSIPPLKPNHWAYKTQTLTTLKTLKSLMEEARKEGIPQEVLDMIVTDVYMEEDSTSSEQKVANG